MAKSLELVGLVLIVIMGLSFVGVFRPSIDAGLSPLFWACAGGAFAIIIYRQKKRKDKENV